MIFTNRCTSTWDSMMAVYMPTFMPRMGLNSNWWWLSAIKDCKVRRYDICGRLCDYWNKRTIKSYVTYSNLSLKCADFYLQDIQIRMFEHNYKLGFVRFTKQKKKNCSESSKQMHLDRHYNFLHRLMIFDEIIYIEIKIGI